MRSSGRRLGGVFVATLLGSALVPMAPAGAAAPTYAATLGGPSVAEMYSSGLEWDGVNNRLVVADTGLNRILFYSLTGTKEGQFGSSGSGTGQFDSPRDTAVDGAGNIYVADAGNNRVSRFSSTGVHAWTLGGTGSCNTCLNTPIGVSWDDANDVLLVASSGQSLIKAFNAAGTFMWKSPAGSVAGFANPRDAIRGPDGRIWVSAYKPGPNGSPTGHQIKAYDVTPAGSWNTTPAIVLGDGQVAGHGDGQLNFPYNAEFSPDGAVLYVSDTGNDRIARWNLTTSPPTWMAPVGGKCADPCPDSSPGLFEHLRRVAVTTDGTIVGADLWGNALQVFGADGNVIRQIAGAAAPAPGFAHAFGVAVGTDGTTYAVDRLNQRIEKFTAAGSYVAQVGTRGVGPGKFSWPEAVAVAPDGNVWVADTRNDRLQRFSANLTAPTVIGGFGTTAGRFSYIEDLDVGPDGTVWVADTRNNRIQSYDPSTGNFTVIGSFGSGPGQFAGPQGVAVSSTAIYVADTGNNRIQKLSLGGTQLGQFATGLAGPQGVAVAPDGTVWVADTANNRILHLTADLAELGDGFGSPGTGNLQFDRPHTLAVHGSRLLVADTYNHRVQVFTISSEPPPPPPFNPVFSRHQSDPGGVAPVYPAGGAADGAGNRYIADSGGSRIVKIDSSGVQTTVSTAGWNDPRDLELDTDGTLWVTDTSDSQIVHITTAGTVLDTFGGPTSFKTPYGMGIDAAGLYVADTYNNRVVKLAKTSGAQQWVQTTCSGKAFSRPRDVAVGSDGDIYVADTDNGRISVLDPATGACVRSFGAKGGGNGQYRSPRALTSDGAGGLWIADALNYRVQHVSNAGTFIAKTTSTFGEATNQFRSAHCVFLDQGQLDVCDTFNYRIQRYTVSAGGVPTFSSVLGGVRPTPGGFNGAFDATYGPGGELYAVDWFNHRIQKFRADGSFETEWGGYGSPNGSLIFPRAIAIGPDGNVVVTDSENNRIDVFTPAGAFVKAVKPSGTVLARPHQTAPAADGSFWVADTNNNRILRLSATGSVLANFNNGGTVKSPRGIAVDSAGNVYVSNYTSSTVEKYNPSGTRLAVLATSGTAAGRVKNPHGLRISGPAGDERLWIADSGNNRVVVLKTGDGSVVGSFGTAGSGAGQLNTPKGVAVNPLNGNVTVADFANNRLSIWTT